MPTYLYVPATNGEWSTAESLPQAFEGPLNLALARKEAEKRFGKGGRLFMEIPGPSYPVIQKSATKIEPRCDGSPADDYA